MSGTFADHEITKHSVGEYVRYTADGSAIHSDTIESVLSIFKRGKNGIYQHCSEKHLHSYLTEFDFRCNYRVKLAVADTAHAEKALLGVKGKRLTYRRPDEASLTA